MSDAAANGLLATRDLHKAYTMGHKRLEVLLGLTLEVARGEFLAIQGASGAGKSTLLHLLCGLDVPDAGEVWFAGVNLAGLTRRRVTDLRNRKVGFIFQAYHLFAELDALENVCLPARLARVPPRQAAERGAQLLTRVGLGQRLEHKPTELSGGEQQRVAIARALVNEPDLILADEPTGNLDSHTGQEIIELLCALRAERGTTLIVATHDAQIAARAPRVVQLIDGRIAGQAAGESGT
jgi:ABC-type lipoprotein export system ATPase subunit